MGKKRSISDDNGGISTAKRTKTTVSSSSKRTGPQPKTDSNGDIYWEISRMRRVTISNFKGRNMVNIREYYEKDGEELPGKKGISLPMDQFSAFLQCLPQIEEFLLQRGEKVPRPVYDDNDEEEEEEAAEEEEDDAGKKKDKKKKSNIEATSEEEEEESEVSEED
ncbi:hypothetical protein VTN49DRAFT_3313 [Thermomyces lanuginosus]|uniref:uncharacterized protein n=1 Tax=Thermomyces lanuginosus TaxID=5541 RepID=UPI003743DD45